MTEYKNPSYPTEVVDHSVMNRVLRHRLRNLCAGVKMTVERIASTTSTINPQIGNRCDIIVAELDNLRDMTDRMDLLFDSLPAPEAKTLFEIVTAMRASFAPKFPFSRLMFDGPEAMITCRHGSWVIVALSELLFNAGEAASDNGEVRLQWKVDDQGLTFIMTNNGEPMPAAVPVNPPQPFVTDKSRHDGLGLSIAWRIAIAVDGKLKITSMPDKSLTGVELNLPRTEFANE